MKVIMTGGGTGGHVNPAIAIAEKIKKEQPGSEIHFVGTPTGIENTLVPKAGYPLHRIEVQGLKRSLSLKNVKTFTLLASAIAKSKKLLDELRPDLVFGTGGYVCFPIVFAAARAGIPTALHEANALPGVAIKNLERMVDRVYVDFEETLKLLKHPEKAMRVGNPLREDFFSASREEAREKLGIAGKYEKVILSYGGSLGAEPINDAVMDFMKDYTASHPEIMHIHSAGTLEYKLSIEKFRSMGLDGYENIKYVDYINDMAAVMAASDVVICRAGAMTLSELAALGKPSVLIPSPYVADNHQYKNAKTLFDGGASEIIEEKDLTGEALAKTVGGMLADGGKLEKMSDAARKFAVKDCAGLIYEDLITNVLK